MASFLDDKVDYDKGSYEIGKDVYDEYNLYCQEYNLNPFARKKFTSRLKNFGIEVEVKSIYGNNKRCYLGIDLTN